MEHDLHKMMMDMDKKLDLMMKHLGCKQMSEEEYLSQPDDKRDDYDADEMKNKMERHEE